MRVQSWLGIAGVAEHENARAKRIANYFDMVGVLIALWIIVVWYQEATHSITLVDMRIHDFFVWGFFTLETITITALVNHRAMYLRGNWLNGLIILAGIPLLLGVNLYAISLGSLRLVLVFNLLVSVSDRLRTFLGRNQLGATLLITTVFTMIAGLIIHGVDSNIHSASDGIWWAWATLTSVGYGDVVPSSIAGRVIAVIVMIVGMGFSALLTASILALFMSEQEGKIVRYTERELAEQFKLEKRLERVEGKLDGLIERLDKGS